VNAGCRLVVAAALAAAVLGLALAGTAVGGAPFPDPVIDQAVYDETGLLSDAVIEELEARIDALEARSGAEVVIYLQVDPFQDFDSNLAAAESLMNQWGIGRQGYDDGFVILVSFQENRINGVLSTYAGSGFRSRTCRRTSRPISATRSSFPPSSSRTWAAACWRRWR
jgi:uncharacterized membrane protein YgcG